MPRLVQPQVVSQTKTLQGSMMVWSRDGNDENDDEDNVKKSGLAHYITAKVVTKTIQVTANLFIAIDI